MARWPDRCLFKDDKQNVISIIRIFTKPHSHPNPEKSKIVAIVIDYRNLVVVGRFQPSSDFGGHSPEVKGAWNVCTLMRANLEKGYEPNSVA